MQLKEVIIGLIKHSAAQEKIELSSSIELTHPEDLAHGDYTTNIALRLAKQVGMTPKLLAQKLAEHMTAVLKIDDAISKIEVAGPGFINFYANQSYIVERIGTVLKEKQKFGHNSALKGKKISIEYTTQNLFKLLHVGHLMSNSIGESVSRLLEAAGAKVIRDNYQGDVGLHVAKAVYGMIQMKTEMPHKNSDWNSIASFIGHAYGSGAHMYETDPDAKSKIAEINKKIYDRSDKEINKIYDRGRQWSLKVFEMAYKILNTHFDYYFFESQTAEPGKKIVENGLANGIFEHSDGAVIFKGENYGLHTRVFITKEGLPTYETKDLGLLELKFKKIKPDQAIVVTANEQTDYFKVIQKVAGLIFPVQAASLKHVPHGMLRLPSGKMSSRTGNVIGALDLINDIQSKMFEKMTKMEKTEVSEKQKISQQVAIAAIRYSVLRQSPGKDIVFEMEKSISTEGDSGPYLQYAAVRASSLLYKAKEQGIKPKLTIPLKKNKDVSGGGSNNKEGSDIFKGYTFELERMITRFPDIVERAVQTLQPNEIALYVMELAAQFNNFYNSQKVIDKNDNLSPYRLAVVSAFLQTMTNALWLLAIEVPKKM